MDGRRPRASAAAAKLGVDGIITNKPDVILGRAKITATAFSRRGNIGLCETFGGIEPTGRTHP